MNWDQIELQWAAMARRVRSDLPKNLRLSPELVGNEVPLLTALSETAPPSLPIVKVGA